ncbi:hypothetical protein HOY82DRAFT_651101 [Tuber indicum]|nr:hypothetical protein HOY82DRAFT_651101 [Tuber indicum]
MARYHPLVAGWLLWLSTLAGLTVSQSAWTLDPQKHLAQIHNHMSVMVNSTIYTLGGAALYWTPNSTPSSIVSANNNSVYIIRTANGFLRALDISKPLDFEAEFSDTTEIISELPLTIPHIKRGALWADRNTIYYWGGELEWESIYMNGGFQNGTREWPDPMKYYTFDLSQPRGFGVWKTVSISEAQGSDVLTSSPSFGEYCYSAEAGKGFYLGGVMARLDLKNKDGSNATNVGTGVYDVSSMVVFDAATNVWKNETTVAELNRLREGVLVYVAGVGEKGILVRMGGDYNNGSHGFVSVTFILRDISISTVSFDTVHVYDIAAGVWYRQPTTSKTNIFPENRLGGFCAGAVAAPDKTSFTIYIYGGLDLSGYIKRTWALTMPYFHWLPVRSTGEPEHGRSTTTCHTIGGQLVMVRGQGKQDNRGDTNGGTYFYDMTNLTWSLKYRPSEYRVPKSIYDIIGGNGQGGATITSPGDDKNFAGGLGKLFASAAPTTHTSSSRIPSSTSGEPSGGGRSSPTGAIVGGVIGGIALLASLGTGVWVLMLLRRRSAGTVGGGGTIGGHPENSLMRMGENPLSPDHRGNPHLGYETYNGPLQQPAPELDNTRV